MSYSDSEQHHLDRKVGNRSGCILSNLSNGLGMRSIKAGMSSKLTFLVLHSSASHFFLLLSVASFFAVRSNRLKDSAESEKEFKYSFAT